MSKRIVLLIVSSVAWLAVVAPAVADRRASQPAPATAAADVPVDYAIGPADVLGVVFWREAEMSGDVTVRPDGRISLPVIGELRAAGLKPIELQEQVRLAAGKFITDPNVVVVVRAINSRKIFVTGLVTTPGGQSLVGPLTVMQAIAQAGGVTEYADSKNITILRAENGQSTVLKFNYKAVSKGKNVEQNIVLKPGDTVVVP
jgi:polysaccharide biosynthesis/export protein